MGIYSLHYRKWHVCWAKLQHHEAWGIFTLLFFVGVEGLEECWWNYVSLNKTILCLSSLSMLVYKYRLMRKGRVGFWLLSQIVSLVIFSSCKLQQKKYFFTNAEPFYNFRVVMLTHYHHSAPSSGVYLNPLLWSPDPCLNEKKSILALSKSNPDFCPTLTVM